MYSVLNIISEYTYFYISKSITLNTFVLVFKIVEGLRCIFKRVSRVEATLGRCYTEELFLEYFQGYL